MRSERETVLPQNSMIAERAKARARECVERRRNASRKTELLRVFALLNGLPPQSFFFIFFLSQFARFFFCFNFLIKNIFTDKFNKGLIFYKKGRV